MPRLSLAAPISVVDVVLTSSVVISTRPPESRLKPPTMFLVPEAAVEVLLSQFSPENEADCATETNWFLSSVSSLSILVLSTPGSRAATSFALISETTSMAEFMPV